MEQTRRIDRFQTPLKEALLLEHNFFELYPFDGGGYFITQAQLKASGDEAVYRAVLQKNALAEFGTLPALDFTKFERWSTIEKTSWLNRLYFLPPLAKMAAVKQDDAAAALVKDTILYFHRNYPPPAGREAVCAMTTRVLESRDRDYNSGNLDGETEYIWFDFQPASRVVNTINAMRFLRHSTVISEAEWAEFDEFIRLHVETLYLDEKYACKLAPGNHQALRGLALLYGAAYFAGEDFAADWTREGERICNYHMVHDYLADGTLIDISPSYHVFETWINRDAMKLADAYGFQIGEDARRMQARSHELCRIFRQPDGGSVVVDDGYSLNMDVFLQTIDASGEPARTARLEASKMAFYRDERFFVMLDASPSVGKYSHFHGGKNAVALWFGGKPFCVDSACCNYDDIEFAEWFKQPDAHSGLFIDGIGDSILQGRYNWVTAAQTELSEWRGHAIESRLTSGVPQWQGVEWLRRVDVSDRVTLHDEVSAAAEHDLTFIFNLHPDVQIELEQEHIVLTNGDMRVILQWECPAAVEWKLRDGLVFWNREKRPAKQLTASVRAASTTFKTVWSC